MQYFGSNNVEGVTEIWVEVDGAGWSRVHGLAISVVENKKKCHYFDNEYFLIVLLYCAGPLGTFIDALQEELTLLPIEYRTVVFGDFDLNQLLEENINILQPILTEFSLS